MVAYNLNVGSWPQLGFDSTRVASNPRETSIGINHAELSLEWQIKLASEGASYPPGAGIPGPTICYERVFVTSAHQYGESILLGCMALDLQAGGDVLWSTPDIDSPCYGTPAVSNGVVYFGSEDGHLYAYDAIEGSRIWRYPDSDIGMVGPFRSSPAVAEGLVLATYLGRYDDLNNTTLVAIDAYTGGLAWAQAGLRLDSSVSSNWNLAYFWGLTDGGASGGLLAANSGGTTFHAAVPSSADPSGSPVCLVNYMGEQFAFVGNEETFYAFSSAGRTLWSYVPPSRSLGGSLGSAFSGGIVLAQGQATLTALDVAGIQRWTYAAPNTTNLGAPSISNDVVFLGQWEVVNRGGTEVPSEGFLVALVVTDNSGVPVWTTSARDIPLGVGQVSAPAIAAGRLCVVSGGGSLLSCLG